MDAPLSIDLLASIRAVALQQEPGEIRLRAGDFDLSMMSRMFLLELLDVAETGVSDLLGPGRLADLKTAESRILKRTSRTVQPHRLQGDRSRLLFVSRELVLGLVAAAEKATSPVT